MPCCSFLMFRPCFPPAVFFCTFRHAKRSLLFFFLSLAFVIATVLIYQFLFLEGSDHLAQQSESRRKWNSLLEWQKKLRYQLKQVKLTSNKTYSACPSLSVQEVSSLTFSSSCRLPKVRQEACALAKSFFTTDPRNQTCNSTQMDLCKIEKTVWGLPKIECHITSCGSSDIISVGFVNPEDGSLSWKHFSFLQDVEKTLNNYVQSTPTNAYFPFAFLRCDEFWNPTAKTQLFILPSRSVSAEKPRRETNKKLINVNIILIDSVSRPHFYRSLPQTVKAFRSINSNSSSLVLDFELFHAIKQRTFESINALFSGELSDVKEFINPVPVKAGVMFGKFKSLGYQTMWQEDMCWAHEWGLVRNLKVMNKSLTLSRVWHNLARVLQNNSIDFTGITHSSCEVLRRFGVSDIFHGPSNLCYGGEHYHALFLEHLEHSIKEGHMDSEKKPLFAFSMLNVGHEESGCRIQTFDSALSNFVNMLASDPNTLSIVLSDHGNNYGSYPRTMEGRFEVFQPHLFMLIPKRVQNLLGKNKIRILKQNQGRLVSIVDLHHTLMAIAAEFGNEWLPQNLGLLQPVLSNRTCDDLGLLISTLCICQGWMTKVNTNSFHFIIAEFALGQLNNNIQTQFLENFQAKRPLSGFQSCERLRGERFDNIREKWIGEVLTVTLDIYVQNQEIFSVTVQVTSGSVIMDMKLTQFTRVSSYGSYQTCADKGLDPRLCVCKNGPSLHESGTTANRLFTENGSYMKATEPPTTMWQHDGNVFNSATTADNIHENCLFILLREHISGVILEAANYCSFVTYTIDLDLSLSNMKISERVPLRKELGPGVILFLMAINQLDPNINWSWKYTVNFSWKIVPVN